MIDRARHLTLSLASAAAISLPLLLTAVPANAGEPFLGQIKAFGFNFAPRGWAFCEGQILPINQNQSLYSLLGTTYGGDGRTSFALPDLRGRVPVHVGSGFGLGQSGGAEFVTLTAAEMPSHLHAVSVSGAQASATLSASSLNGDLNTAAGHALAPGGSRTRDFQSAAPDVTMHAGSISVVNDMTATVASTGSGEGHNNMQPYLTVNYSIALRGLFPSRN